MNYKQLTRRELMMMLQSLASLPLFQACKQFSPKSSGTKDLTDFTSLTDFNPKRVELVRKKFDIDSWNKYSGSSGRQDVFDNLSVVPDIYLEFLQERANTADFTITAGGQAAGMCSSDGIGARWITLNSPSFATIHEVGHGVESFTYRHLKIKDGDDLRDRTYREVIVSSEKSAIRAYAKKNSKELFADGFSSFYRSPKSRADLAKMTLTWTWLKTVLVCPVNLSPSENADDFIASPSELATNPSSKAPIKLDMDIAAGDKSENLADASKPSSTPAPSNDPCKSPEDQVTEFLCQLSRTLSGGPGTGLGLLDGDQLILPNENQSLTAFDRFLVMTKLSLTEKEASLVRIYLDKELITTGLVKDRYAGGADIFSMMIQLPEHLTPKDISAEAPRTLTIVLRSKILFSRQVQVSRFSLCGDITDFKPL